jgi:hypothetical protein
VVVTDLQSGRQTRIDLPNVPTDLDVSEDGSFAILVFARPGGSTIAEVPLPIAASPGYTIHPIGTEYVGQAVIAPDGRSLILFTSVDPGQDGAASEQDPRQRVTIARRSAGGWTELVNLFSEVPLKSVGIAPSSRTAIFLHEQAPARNPEAPWPYTLVDIGRPFPVKKLQMVEAEPRQILLTPGGERAIVLLRDDRKGVRRLDLIDLASFIVGDLRLGSPPESAGYVAATDKVFVSQDHPTGRITFIGGDGTVQTVTGYELNDAVKD